MGRRGHGKTVWKILHQFRKENRVNVQGSEEKMERSPWSFWLDEKEDGLDGPEMRRAKVTPTLLAGETGTF